MQAVRQTIAAEIENKTLQEDCSNLQSLSPQRELTNSSSFYSSNHVMQSFCHSCSQIVIVNFVPKFLLLQMTLTIHHCRTYLWTVLLNHCTEEQSSPRKSHFCNSEPSDRENNQFKLKAQFHL